MNLETALKDVIDAATRGDTDKVVQVQARSDAAKWLQLTWDTLNAAYPFAEEPTACLRNLGLRVPADWGLTGWSPHGYVTFEHGSDIQEVSRFAADYLARVMATSAESALISVEWL